MHKYRIEKRLGQGRFANVFQAYDTIEGIHVALKIFPFGARQAARKAFEQEARIAAMLDHENIVRLKSAEIIDNTCLLVTELGEKTLADAMERPRPARFAIHVLHEVIQGLAYAHERNVIHRDIKPENIMVWKDGRVKIADFDVSRLGEPTTHTTVSGTPSYRAPEQAYGRPQFASDVFALALVFYEMVTRVLPRWPFRWPFERHDVFASRVSPSLVSITRRAASFDLDRRYKNARTLLEAVHKASPELTQRSVLQPISNGRRLPWQEYRRREFEQRYGVRLALDYRCHRCSGPISEFMTACPWCGFDKNSFDRISTFPAVCARCERGVHEDWRFCPWCYGPRFGVVSVIPSLDRRYDGRCPNTRCRETRLLPHMRHCPWCNARLRPWRSAFLTGRCGSCQSSVAPGYWDHCPWCAKDFSSTRTKRRPLRRST